MSDTPNRPANVHILMATYNGAQYISQQIQSLQAQTHGQWSLLVRDDGSSDKTVGIVSEMARSDPRITLVDDSHTIPLGSAGNFGVLMELALSDGAGYICFCDQDDIWHPDKIARQLERVRWWENAQGNNHPTLVYSDLEVVDQRQLTIAASFYKYQRIRRAIEEPSFTTLIAQNHVVGCTVLMNAPLLKLASPLPDGVYMHDWWVALCAGACGTLDYLPEATVRYRRHCGNVAGVGGLRRLGNLGAAKALLDKMNRIFRCSIEQANCLSTRLEERNGDIPEGNHVEIARSGLKAWASLLCNSSPHRLAIALRGRYRSQNLALTVLLYLQLLMLRSR